MSKLVSITYDYEDCCFYKINPEQVRMIQWNGKDCYTIWIVGIKEPIAINYEGWDDDSCDMIHQEMEELGL